MDAKHIVTCHYMSRSLLGGLRYLVGIRKIMYEVFNFARMSSLMVENSFFNYKENLWHFFWPGGFKISVMKLRPKTMTRQITFNRKIHVCRTYSVNHDRFLRSVTSSVIKTTRKKSDTGSHCTHEATITRTGTRLGVRHDLSLPTLERLSCSGVWILGLIAVSLVSPQFSRQQASMVQLKYSTGSNWHIQILKSYGVYLQGYIVRVCIVGCEKIKFYVRPSFEGWGRFFSIYISKAHIFVLRCSPFDHGYHFFYQKSPVERFIRSWPHYNAIMVRLKPYALPFFLEKPIYELYDAITATRSIMTAKTSILKKWSSYNMLSASLFFSSDDTVDIVENKIARGFSISPICLAKLIAVVKV